MHSTFLSLSAYALAGSSAFMIPPNGDVADDGTFRIALPNLPAPIESFGVDPYSQIVQLPCPGCPMAQFGEQGVSWTRDEENYLVLNISVGASSKRLELSGVQIFPPALALVGEPEVLQVPSYMSLEQLRAPARKVVPAQSLRLSAWTLRASEVHNSPDSQEEIIDMHLRIHAIEQRPVRIPEVVITAVKDRNGDLLIVKALPSKQPYTPEEERKDCNMWPLLCKWKAAVSSKLDAMRHKMHMGCHKRPGAGMMGGPAPAHGKKPHHHDRPHHHSKPHHSRPHHTGHMGGHHRQPHNHHHVFMHKVAQVLLTVVIPLLIGILAGMVTYLIGMLAGTAIAWIWIKIRGRRTRYAPVALTEEDSEEGRVSYEKGEFEEDDFKDAPPVYVAEE